MSENATTPPARLAHPMIFVNLVVEDVKASLAFYRSLGFHENEIFRDETTASMEVSDAGGRITREPAAQGPMYGAAFDDPDGHGWELMWMDPAALAAMGQEGAGRE